MSLRAKLCAQSKGFTLMEVMIALAIFAILAMALSRHSSELVAAANRSQVQGLALQLAENELHRVLAARSWPALGERSYPREYGGGEFEVTVVTTETANFLLRRVEISVKTEDGRSNQLASLYGFKGEG